MNKMRLLWIPFVCLVALLAQTPAQTPRKTPPVDSARTFQGTVQPFFAKNCYACHNAAMNTGGLNLESFKTPESVIAERERFELVLKRLKAGEMPPAGLPHPPAADVAAVTNWIQSEFARADAAVKPFPGRVTARRLNRAEYNNTVRDLLGVDFHPADDFPQDDSGYGFDDIGDALSLSPVLMEKYLTAAEKVTRTAIFGIENLKATVIRHQPPYREGSDGGNNGRFLAALPYTITNYDLTGLTLPSSVHTMHTFPAEGDYEVRISPEGNRPRPSDPFPVAVWIDGKQVASVDFEATGTFGTGMEGLDKTVMIHAPAGEHWVAASALRLYEGLPATFGGLNPTKKTADPPIVPAGIGTPLPDNATPEQKAEFAAQQAAAAARGRGGRGGSGRGGAAGGSGRAGFGGGGRANKPPSVTDVSFRVNFIEIGGPFHPKTAPSQESLNKIFVCKEHTAACERQIVTNLARRAYRRPPTVQETSRLLALVAEDQKRGTSFEQSIGTAVEAMLVSPSFLFRIESDPAPGPAGDPEHHIGQYDLASRLSYFLWSSMPDDELLRCADQKILSNPVTLNAQVRRMLKDPKAKALVDNFGGQWLRFRAMESVKPDPVRFMAFNDYLRISMQQETAMFLQNLISTDGSVLDLLGGKYSFLNEELAQFYGIKGVSGAEFRKVDLTGTHRAGILTQGSVLTTSSYSTRTSVVLRGKWVLENLLNAPVPPPPPNVPPLDETSVGTAMSLRQQMEKHRANAVCASCHARMDPIGFGLENFDAIGRWRTEDGTFPIDATGTLPNGKSFNGPEELINILMQNKDAFTQCMTEKMLTYALGRGLETYDQPTVRSITAKVVADNYKISSMILGIVDSLPFQQREGDRATK